MRSSLIKSAIAAACLVSGNAYAQVSGLPMATFATGGTGLTPFYVLGFELGPWQDYLTRELTPSYLTDVDEPPLHISWLSDQDVFILPAFAQKLLNREDFLFSMSMEWQASNEYSVLDGLSYDKPASLIGFGSSFERQYLAPGILHQLSDTGVLGVSAVFAFQRYSASNLGLYNSTGLDGVQDSVYSPYQESGYGTGVRLAVKNQLLANVDWTAGFQSRIDMEEFANYRGVYSEPADLDIPARAHVGLEFQASDKSSLSVAVERVLYSDISPFPSRFLPDRFLSLLGDSTSPDLSWDDLTVYSVDWRWSNGSDTQWRVGFSTRPQPLPTSTVLSQALTNDLADSAMMLGYSKQLSRNGQLSVNAAYAPPEFAFGGSVLGVTSDDLNQAFEIEALWILSF